jgi:hypothetical protein
MKSRGAYDTPSEPCPYCGAICEADWCDVGVGMVQCGPYHCVECLASEIGPNDDERHLTERERKLGWYAPGSEPGSSANVIGGEIVSHHEAKAAYRARFSGPVGNGDWATPGIADAWWEEQRKKP